MEDRGNSVPRTLWNVNISRLPVSGTKRDSKHCNLSPLNTTPVSPSKMRRMGGCNVVEHICAPGKASPKLQPSSPLNNILNTKTPLSQSKQRVEVRKIHASSMIPIRPSPLALKCDNVQVASKIPAYREIPSAEKSRHSLYNYKVNLTPILPRVDSTKFKGHLCDFNSADNKNSSIEKSSKKVLLPPLGTKNTLIDKETQFGEKMGVPFTTRSDSIIANSDMGVSKAKIIASNSPLSRLNSSPTILNNRARSPIKLQTLGSIKKNIFDSDLRKESPFQRTPGSSVSRAAVSAIQSNNKRNSPSLPNKRSGRLSVYGLPMIKSPSVRQTSSGECRRIVVCARKRPLSSREQGRGEPECVSVCNRGETLNVSVTKTKLDGWTKTEEDHSFRFDKVFDENATNENVYYRIVSPLLLHAQDGYRSCIFAYGQTGSGKTFTMFDLHNGLCVQSFSDSFKSTGVSCIDISFYEIYQSQLFDLLSDRRRLNPCEGANGIVQILGLETVKVTSREEATLILKKGLEARATGKTGANSQSSRSHAILHINFPNGGAISFVDLAGSERGADRQEVDRKTKLEGSEINKSLLALKECIRAMDQDSTHLPFRQSKLTLVLKDSIVGAESRTAMIATVSPAASSSEHTLNTLRYAERFLDVAGGGTVMLSEPTNVPDATEQWNAQEAQPIVYRPIDLKRSPRYQVSEVKETKSKASNPPEEETSVDVQRMTPLIHNIGKTLSSETFNSKDISLSDERRLIDRRARVIGVLGELQRLAISCQDFDMLELLGEELISTSQTFNSLSART